MYTEIVLEYPYNQDWDKASVRMCLDGRRRITLWKEGRRKGTAYARYLMAVKLGRYLTRDEIVDHKDEDRTNDDIDNLQILTNAENVKKHHRFKYEVRRNSDNPVECLLECAVCHEYFIRRANRVKTATKAGYALTCSRSCRGKLPKKGTPRHKEHPKETIDLVMRLYGQGESSYSIAEIAGIPRSQAQRIPQRYREHPDYILPQELKEL